MAPGFSHALVLKADGSVSAWGYNYSGQLGLGDRWQRYGPQPVTGLAGIRKLAASSSHSFALQADGRLLGWGDNYHGQLGLGDGSCNPCTLPQLLPGLDNVEDIATGSGYTVAVRRDGTVWSWGSNLEGALGHGDMQSRNVPTRIAGLQDIVAVKAGYAHVLALKSDGTLWTWGQNYSGQLGTGDVRTRLRPVRVAAMDGVLSMATGQYSSMVLRADGTVWSWGDNGMGQLGLGDYYRRLGPNRIAGLNDVVDLAAAGWISFALKRDGTLWAFGYNGWGELGIGPAPRVACPNDRCNRPQLVSALSNVVAIGAGYHSGMAFLSDGSFWTWGWNEHGQLGMGDRELVKAYLPMQVGASRHVASWVNESPVELPTLHRGSTTSAHSLWLYVSGQMDRMDFRPENVGLFGNLGLRYNDNSCTLGTVNASCGFKLSAHPVSDTGPQSGMAVIPASNTFARAVMVPAYATVNGAHLLLADRKSQGYGKVAVGEKLERTWTFVNRGNELVSWSSPAEIGGAAFQGAAFQIVEDSCTGSTWYMEPYQKCQIRVQFAPSAAGAQQATLILHSDDPANPELKVGLYGTGI